MQAFIIRPFSTKNEIDFDRVETDLIAPALDRLGITGRTTGEIVRQGNIRTDMFIKLLAADIVVADVSIHNANVFYELGIRHALRDRLSFLIKSRGDHVPFDLLTDRYFYYDAAEPGARLDELVVALRASIDSIDRDSPVYQLLPRLKPANPEDLNLVPFDFREDVQQAAKRGATGVLRLLADEAAAFDWAIEGMRVVGQAQFDLGDSLGAKTTWETVQTRYPMDTEANELLGTIYQRLDDLERSDKVLRRILKADALTEIELARVQALLGRNAKTRWLRDWSDREDREARREAALRSPHLESSVDGYERGSRENRNDCYAGLNALAQVVILTELATELPEVWRERFEDDQSAAFTLSRLTSMRRELEVGVKLAVDSDLYRALRDDELDGWAQISEARLTHLVSDNPNRVAHLYTKALVGKSDYALESSSRELELFLELGIRTGNSEAAVGAIANLKAAATQPETGLERIVLFAGHRIDSDNRETPRFPPSSEQEARRRIREALTQELAVADASVLGISGGASGGDILFQEVCAELGIRSELFLAFPEQEYCRMCVQDAGPIWVERFYRLCNTVKSQVLSDSGGLPRWLRDRETAGYDVFLRSSHWMMHNALSSGSSCTVIALWDGAKPDGPGGTYDIIDETKRHGVKFVHLDARELAADESTIAGQD